MKEIIDRYRKRLYDAELTLDVDRALNDLYQDLCEHRQSELDEIAAEMEAEDEVW